MCGVRVRCSTCAVLKAICCDGATAQYLQAEDSGLARIRVGATTGLSRYSYPSFLFWGTIDGTGWALYTYVFSYLVGVAIIVIGGVLALLYGLKDFLHFAKNFEDVKRAFGRPLILGLEVPIPSCSNTIATCDAPTATLNLSS